MDGKQFIEICETSLAAMGYILTAPRRAVIEVVAHSTRALNTAEIATQALAHCPRLGRATVFRTLATLEQLGLVQSVYHPNDGHVYIPVGGKQHGFVICQDCARIDPIDNPHLETVLSAVSQQYLAHRHWLQLFGLCTNCQTSE